MVFFPYTRHRRNLTDAVALLDKYTTYSTGSFVQDVNDGAPLSDTFTYVLTHEEILESVSLEDELDLADSFDVSLYQMFNASFDDTLPLIDTFTQSITQKVVFDFVDGLSLQDRNAVRGTERYTKTFETDFTSIFDDFGIYSTYRTNILKEDFVGIGEVFGYQFKEAPYAYLNDVLSLSEEFTAYKPHIQVRNLTDRLYLDSILKRMVNLIVLEGTGSGVYEPGVSVPIAVVLKNNEHFTVWAGDTNAILGVTSKSTNIVVSGATVKIVAIKGKVPREFALDGDVMTAAVVDIIMQQGSTFERNIYYKDSNGDPLSLVGFTAALQVRKAKNSTDVEMSISSAGGEIVINGSLGHIEIHIPATVMDILDFDYGFYDLELSPEGDSGQTFRLLEGRVKLIRQVTR